MLFARVAAIALLSLVAGPHVAAAQARASGGAVDAALIADLVAAHHILADQGVLDAYGHVSIRHPANPNRYLIARAMSPANVTAADIMEFDLDSNPVDQRGRSMFLERFIHGEVYKARPDVNAVIHSHSPGVIPFGITNVPMRPVLHTAAFLHVGVPVWEIRNAGGATDMLVRNGALAKSLAATLGDKPVALMRGHGNVVVGPNVKRATIRAVYTEVNARLQTTALGLGGPVNYLSPEEGVLRDKNPGDEGRAWDGWKEKAKAAVGTAAAAAKPGDLIVSNSDWHEAQLREQRLPLATELDRVSAANPVVLVRGGHDYILNSAALRQWKISKDTPVPDGGAISRDAHGELTGELVDNAKRLVSLPPPKAVTVADVLTTQRKVNAYGITSVRIPGSYKGEFFQALDAILAVRRAGELSLRYSIYLPGSGVRDPARIREIIEKSPLKQDEGDEWVRVGGIKLLVDGGFEGGHMSEPFAGEYGKGGNFYGLTVVPPKQYNAVVKTINDLGWRATTHAVGDAAIDQVLDAYEAANAEHGIGGKGWAIEHLFVSRPEQLVRMKKLGLILSVQDHLYLAAPALKNYLGVARASRITPVKSYLDAGFLVVGGTDSPVVPFNPFFAYYHFLTRNTISDGVYGADERVTDRENLLRMITINYSALTGEADVKGSIEPGKLADFAVLSENLLTVEEAKIPTMRAMLTYVGGREVFRDAAMK